MDREIEHQVVINDEGQYSVWPTASVLPAGWRQTGFGASKEACLEHIRTVWTDMRPISLRRSMDGTPGAER